MNRRMALAWCKRSVILFPSPIHHLDLMLLAYKQQRASSLNSTPTLARHRPRSCLHHSFSFFAFFLPNPSSEIPFSIPHDSVASIPPSRYIEVRRPTFSLLGSELRRRMSILPFVCLFSLPTRTDAEHQRSYECRFHHDTRGWL